VYVWRATRATLMPLRRVVTCLKVSGGSRIGSLVDTPAAAPERADGTRHPSLFVGMDLADRVAVSLPVSSCLPEHLGHVTCSA